MEAQPDSIKLFDTAITNLSFEEVCDRIEQHVKSGRTGYIVTPNVDHMCQCYRNPRFRKAYDDAFLALPDGVPILWASKLCGTPLRHKLSGSDMVPLLCEFAARKGFSVFFFGGAPNTAAASAKALKRQHPHLEIAGVSCPPYGFEKDPQSIQAVIAHLRSVKPDICFVGLGSPKQELWLYEHHQATGVPVSMGVGGTFDFISGRIRRAPRWMQRAGLEWLWRLAMEPRRLGRRYLWEDLVFFKLLWRQLRKARQKEAAR